jgi:hypothetical protein
MRLTERAEALREFRAWFDALELEGAPRRDDVLAWIEETRAGKKFSRKVHPVVLSLDGCILKGASKTDQPLIKAHDDGVDIKGCFLRPVTRRDHRELEKKAKPAKKGKGEK